MRLIEFLFKKEKKMTYGLFTIKNGFANELVNNIIFRICIIFWGRQIAKCKEAADLRSN